MILSVCDKEGLDGDTTSWEACIAVAGSRRGKEEEGRGKDENDGRIQETNTRIYIRIRTHLLDKKR